ncbi:acetylornithine aminotransferase apoenzyme [Cyclonatronum proteinivorum]|uniref:Acetylornithine aminotransferase n=1 Tax=Cyclonatronum proteinivorum TaxID=1457365 RepID=A0A345UIW1_9BACT|nr:aspartate aminotransferase family protein [Cyclonatronum proteinivorum]AXJ00413.1 acetylornithine aminotransferase apoenzyme [Cyclonatronum proteinivorum]
MSEKSHHQLDTEVHFKTYKRYPVTLVKGEGSKVVDTEGKTYIDALAGIAVNNVGHCHPSVVAAIRKQAGEIIHTSNFFTTPQQVELAQKLVDLSNHDRVFFCNSGTEAIEGALKLAKRYANKTGKKGDIISFKGAFHGRTLGALAMGQPKYQQGFEPMLPGFTQIPFNDIQAAEAVINDDTVAVFIEPIQGEGGIHVADKAFINQLSALCYEYKALLIFDEIQCGIGRTGKFFAYEHFDIVPDVVCMAKGLGGGFPIGAFIATEEVAEVIEYGKHGTTFGGNPLACCAGLATIEAIFDENMLRMAQENGKWLRDRIRMEMPGEAGISEVRGLGLMTGVQLNFEASGVALRMLENGVIANVTATNVVRLVPALNISREELDTVVDVMVEAIAAERRAQRESAEIAD